MYMRKQELSAIMGGCESEDVVLSGVCIVKRVNAFRCVLCVCVCLCGVFCVRGACGGLCVLVLV